jgi:hypothetical protein
MKKSKAVPAVFVAGFTAAMISGCSNQQSQPRSCIDAQGNVLPDIMCRQATSSGVVVGHWGYPSIHTGGGGYAGGGGGGRYGGTFGGGSTGASVGGGVSRGGFGGMGEGFGAGG